MVDALGLKRRVAYRFTVGAVKTPGHADVRLSETILKLTFAVFIRVTALVRRTDRLRQRASVAMRSAS